MNKLEQAMEDHKQGNYQKADVVYQEIILEEPENADVLYFLATSQMSQNKLDDALASIEKAIETGERAPSFYQVKGSILARMGKVDEALNELEKAIDGNPNLYQSYIVMGHLYYTKGDRKQAEKHFKLAVKIDANQPEGNVNLARILIDDGEIEKAISILRTVEKEHPEQASIKMMLGQAFIENGAYNLAENYFQKVLAMHPEYDLAGLYLGITKLNTGDMKNAEKLINSYNLQYPNTREGIAAIGLLKYKNDKFTMAAEYLRAAIGEGLSPQSWRKAFVESLARLGAYEQAVEFYKHLESKFNDKAAEYRLGELFELQSKTGKAKKQYQKIKQNDSKYIGSLLGLSRIYLKENKPEKAEKHARKVLEITNKHAEAILLLLNCLLFQDRQKQALDLLESLNYQEFNAIYKKTFRIQHGMILDQQKEYQKAMAVFTDLNKQEKTQVQELDKLSEQDTSRIRKFTSEIVDDKVNPVFIIGAQSTGIKDFVDWLNTQGVKALNDRLVSLGRPDILYGFRTIDTLEAVDNEMVGIERTIYHQKLKVYMPGIEENSLFADSMYINPHQVSIIKKFFPSSHVILLTRDTADIWLNQKVFGEEPIASKDWNEVQNQIISMGLNLTQVDMDKWLKNDVETLAIISKVFNKDLEYSEIESSKYWRKNHFSKGHWKNYKDYLGQ